jgi:hypothetical protein
MSIISKFKLFHYTAITSGHTYLLYYKTLEAHYIIPANSVQSPNIQLHIMYCKITSNLHDQY